MKELMELFSAIRPLQPKLEKCLTEVFERVEIPQRTIIKRGGVPPEYLFFIEKGTLSIYREDKYRQPIITGFAKERDIIFDDKNLLLQTVSDEYIIANEPIVLYRMHFSSMANVLTTYHDFNYYLFALAGANCQELRKRCDLLALPGTKRYMKFKDAYNDIHFRMPITHLCSYLGISRATFYQAVKRARR